MTEVDSDDHNYEELWIDYGFSKNPYDYRPLRVASEARELFVGRSKEQEQFKMLTAGTEGGIIIIEGATGVGKTSFVNAMLYDKWNPQHKKRKTSKKSYSYLPSFDIIQLKENHEITEFMLSVLSSCIFSLEKIHGSDVSNSDPDLKAGKELIANTVRSGLGALNLSILGSGGGVEKRENVMQPASIPLPTIMNTMDKWFDRVVRKFGYESTLVPINNIDVLPEQSVIAFLNSARDILLLRNHVWWILIAGPGLFSTLETNARRVSELVTGQPVILTPMSLEDVLKAVNTRIEKLRMNKTAQPPIPQGTIKLLYDASNGEIRYIFKRLTDLIYEFHTAFPSERQIPEEIASKSVRVLARQKINSRNLTEKEKQVLKQMAVEDNFRIRDYSKFGYNSPQALNRLISKFVRTSLLRRVEKNYHEVYYSTAGDVNLVFREKLTG
ncbi:MAG: hypothetical protein ACREBQ_03825 [Nitrososphaerales archaeon]